MSICDGGRYFVGKKTLICIFHSENQQIIPKLKKKKEVVV